MWSVRLATIRTRLAIFFGAGLSLAAVSCAQPRAKDSSKKSVQVRIDSMGVAGINGSAFSILMYADGAASVTFGSQAPHLLTDTVRLRSIPSYTLDVSSGDVHVELTDGQLEGGGVISLSGFVVGADTGRMRAVGRHLVVEDGGRGIRVVDRGNLKLKPIAF